MPARVLGDEGCEGQDKYWTVSGGGGAGEGIGGRRVAIQGLDCEGQDKYRAVSGGWTACGGRWWRWEGNELGDKGIGGKCTVWRRGVLS